MRRTTKFQMIILDTINASQISLGKEKDIIICIGETGLLYRKKKLIGPFPYQIQQDKSQPDQTV